MFIAYRIRELRVDKGRESVGGGLRCNRHGSHYTYSPLVIGEGSLEETVHLTYPQP